MTKICQDSNFWQYPSIRCMTVWNTTLFSHSKILILITMSIDQGKSLNCDGRAIFHSFGWFVIVVSPSISMTMTMTRVKYFARLQVFSVCRITCYKAEEGGDHDPHLVEADPHPLDGDPLASHHNQITIFHCLSTNSHWAHHIPLHRVTVVHVCNFFSLVSHCLLLDFGCPQNFLLPPHLITFTSPITNFTVK